MTAEPPTVPIVVSHVLGGAVDREGDAGERDAGHGPRTLAGGGDGARSARRRLVRGVGRERSRESRARRRGRRCERHRRERVAGERGCEQERDCAPLVGVRSPWRARQASSPSAPRLSSTTAKRSGVIVMSCREASGVGAVRGRPCARPGCACASAPRRRARRGRVGDAACSSCSAKSGSKQASHSNSPGPPSPVPTSGIS